MKWTFNIYLWNKEGSELLDKRTITLKRKCRFVAKEYATRKFPYPYFVELK